MVTSRTLKAAKPTGKGAAPNGGMRNEELENEAGCPNFLIPHSSFLIKPKALRRIKISSAAMLIAISSGVWL